MGDLAPRLSDVRGGGELRARNFVAAVRSLAITKGDMLSASEVCAEKFPHAPSAPLYLQKAAINFGTTTDSDFADPLVNAVFVEAAELVRAASVLGKLTNARRIPFNTTVPRQLTASSVGWTGQGAPKRVSEIHYDSVTLPAAAVSGIVVISQELARSSALSAETLIRNDLIKSIAGFIDTAFLDPSATAVLNTSPASITSGTTPVTSSGSSAIQIAGDLVAVVDQLLAAGSQLTSLTWVMKPATAVKLAGKMDTAGSPAFPNVTVTGGTLLGVPVVVSGSVSGSVSGGNQIVLLDQDRLLVSDAGPIDTSVSGEASVQMNDAPSAGAQNLVSLFQMNLVGIRCTKWINWTSAGTAAAYLDGI